MSLQCPKFRDDLFIHSEDNRILYLYPEAPDWITINLKYKSIFDLFTGEYDIQEINAFIESNYKLESHILIPQINNFIQSSKLFSHNHIQNIIHEDNRFVPKYIYLTLTDQCNLSCVYCYAEERRKRDNASFEDWCFYIDSVIELAGECTFIFTGGEPLLVPYAFELAEYIKGKGSSSILLTNGILIDNKNVASKISSLFVHTRVSLDSVNEEINAKLRGTNTLEKVVNAIGLLESAGANYVVMPTVCNLNKDEIDDISRFFNEKVHFQPLYQMGRGRCSPDLSISGEDYYISLTKTSSFKYLQGYHNTINNYRNKPFKRCAMAKEEISIASNGDLFPCHMLHYDELKIGNLREDAFSNCYYSSTLLSHLRNVGVDNIEQCSKCVYRNFCGGACRARVDYKENGIFGFNKFCDFEQKAILSALLYSFG